MKSQPLFEDHHPDPTPAVSGGRVGDTDPSSERFSSSDERQELFLPVTGFVWLYPEEMAVVDHPAFQRLGGVYQLGQTYLVYRGATHRRIEHVLGAVYVVQRMIDSVRHNSGKAKSRALNTGAPLNMHEQRFTRLGALLHDIGHVTAGHTLEDELGLIGKHDEDARLDRVFNGLVWTNGQGQTLGQVIDTRFQRYVPPGLIERASASEIVRLLIRKPPHEQMDDPHRESQKALERSDEIRMQVCRDMIGDTICADLLDYLHRDWYHVGKPRPFDERILQYMEIRSTPDKLEVPPLKPKASDTFVISLGSRPKIRTDAISAILDLLEWRYQLTESVLFHRAKLAAAAMLDRGLYELLRGKTGEEVEEFVLPLSDDEFLSECRRLAEKIGTAEARIAGELFRSLQRRDLYTPLSTFTHDALPSNVRTAVQTTYAKAETRARALAVLESDFGLPAGSIAMYCPSTAAMNAKIASVRIAIDREVEKFNQYEEKYEDQLSGGHLDAQLRRFRRLWRAHFFIDETAKAKLSSEMLHALNQAIEKLVLGNVTEAERTDCVHGLACQLTTLQASPWKNRGVRKEALAAAFRDEDAALGVYPFGAPSIRAYIAAEIGASDAK